MIDIVRTVEDAMTFAEELRKIHGGDLSYCVNSEKALVILAEELKKRSAAPQKRKAANQGPAV